MMPNISINANDEFKEFCEAPTKIIFSLEEEISLDVTRGIETLVDQIAEMKKVNEPSEIDLIRQQVGAAFYQCRPKQRAFKLNKISKDEIYTNILDALKDKTGIQLSKEILNKTWDEMNPDYTTFKDFLAAAAKMNEEKNQKLLFIRFTNINELNFLISQLEKADVKHTRDEEGNLTSLNGIPFIASCSVQKYEEEILADVVNIIRERKPTKSPLISLNVHNQMDKKEDKINPYNITYVYGPNREKYDACRMQFEPSVQPITTTIATLNIGAVYRSKGQSLDLILKLQEKFDNLNT